MKKLTASEKVWVIVFLAILVALMAGCMIATLTGSSAWNPRPSPPIQ